MNKETLIIGLGNPILTDDAVGIKVARALEAGDSMGGEGLPDGVQVAEASVGGLRLMELMIGYERVVLIDAIKTPGGQPGHVSILSVDALPRTLNTASSHDTNLTTALEAGRRLGAKLPADEHIHIVAIEAEDVLTFGERCTPAVEAAIPLAERVVRQLLENT